MIHPRVAAGRTWVRSVFGAHGGFPALLESAVLLLLLALVVRQYLAYGIVDDPDPDGYVSYANHLLANWSLPEQHRRLPGYPLFLALVDRIGPSGMLQDAYWAQLALTVLLILAMWRWVRQCHGAWVAALFAAAFAVPDNFFVYFATIGMSDLLRQVFLTLYFYLLIRYLDRDVRVPDYRSGAALAITATLAYLVHPGTQGMVYLFLFFLVAWSFALGQVRKLAIDFPLDKKIVGKAVLVAAMLALVVAASQRLADHGNAVFYENWSGWRVAMCLPAGRSSDLTSRIESAKKEISDRIGYPIQYARPNIFPELGDVPLDEAPPFGAMPKQWREEKWSRLRAHPVEYVGCMLREVLNRHYDIVSHYFPFAPDRSFSKPTYRPADSSPLSLLYRSTGIDLVGLPPTAEWLEIWGPLAWAMVKLVLFYGLLLVGIREAATRAPVMALALTATGIAWCLAVVTIVALEPRYLLPFAPLIHLAHALAVVSLVRRCVRHRTGVGMLKPLLRRPGEDQTCGRGAEIRGSELLRADSRKGGR